MALVLFLGAWFIATHVQDTSETYPLSWREYTARDGAISGSLFLLRRSADGLSVYLALDKTPSDAEVMLSEGWTLSKVSEGELWNPRECAKMPTLVTKEGGIFMLDSRREREGGFSKLFVEYSPLQAIHSVDIEALNWRGLFLFSNAQGLPYFFGIQNNTLVSYALSSDKSSLRISSLRPLRAKDTLSFARSPEGAPVISVYNGDTLETSRVRYGEGALASYAGDIQQGVYASTTAEENIVALKHNLSARYRQDTPYATTVNYKESPVLSFVKGSNIYAYVIGSFGGSPGS